MMPQILRLWQLRFLTGILKNATLQSMIQYLSDIKNKYNSKDFEIFVNESYCFHLFLETWLFDGNMCNYGNNIFYIFWESQLFNCNNNFWQEKEGFVTEFYQSFLNNICNRYSDSKRMGISSSGCKYLSMRKQTSLSVH